MRYTENNNFKIYNNANNNRIRSKRVETVKRNCCYLLSSHRTATSINNDFNPYPF